ncbi:hypothetical protein CCL13_12265 [Pseudomonas syringae]|nr:hypothetical protein CCL13_12265 [Pseudomonas syringae]
MQFTNIAEVFNFELAFSPWNLHTKSSLSLSHLKFELQNFEFWSSNQQSDGSILKLGSVNRLVVTDMAGQILHFWMAALMCF